MIWPSFAFRFGKLTLERGSGKLNAGGVGTLQPSGQQILLQLQEELVPATNQGITNVPWERVMTREHPVYSSHSKMQTEQVCRKNINIII